MDIYSTKDEFQHDCYILLLLNSSLVCVVQVSANVTNETCY